MKNIDQNTEYWEYNVEITSKDEVSLLDRTITKILSDIKNTRANLEISEKKCKTLLNIK